MRLKITDDAGSTGEYKSHEEYVKTGAQPTYRRPRSSGGGAHEVWDGYNSMLMPKEDQIGHKTGLAVLGMCTVGGLIISFGVSEIPIAAGCGLGKGGAAFGLGASGAGSIAANKGAEVIERVGKPGPVIVGETMKRVEFEAGKHIDSKILNDMPEYWNMGLKDYEVTSKMMEYNRKWILEQFRSGKPIIDIGLDINRKEPSIFYQMEQNMIKNYQKLNPEWNAYTKLGR